MSEHQPHDRDALPPELLAAYADGELAPAECRRVEDWLAAHPEARADVEAQRRLARLFDEAAPPAPADERWAGSRAAWARRRIAGAGSSSRLPPCLPRPPSSWRWG
jgi:anti-sigma factor RsiW